MAPKDAHGHDHAQLQSERGPYAAFVDELFRLGQIDAGKRDFLRRGLALAAGEPAPRVAQPSSAGIKYSDEAASLVWPRAETPTHWITLGLHETLEEAMKMAIRETIDFLVAEKGLTREDAYALSSIAVDFEVTQVVDGVKGIHGMIPKAIFVG